MKYYIICDNTSCILAIHKIADSAYVCFERLTKSGNVPLFLSLMRVETDIFGIKKNEVSILTFSKSSGITLVLSEP